MSNIYAELCLSVQALRRDFEGLRTPLAPATGVGAFIYTHQVANVHRVLTDVRVRHLLADEVGLGKTVQALMILNALRFQRRDLRALVVVPDRLVLQWRDEILTRAHSVPIGAEIDGEGGQYIRLAWEAQLRKPADETAQWSLSDIDPDRYDILVVDELHQLTSRLQNRIVRVAGQFEHILLLTATPEFQDVRRHARLFAMLEPERSQLAKSPDGVDREIVERLLERDRVAAESVAAEDLEAVALANCAYRRVIRTRRVDYGALLPTRRHVPILTEPLGAEAERQDLMWQYFAHLGDLTLDVEPVKLAKRVVLSPTSLEQRVDFLRRKGHDRKGLLERAKPLVHRRNGDSRADALVDLLSEIWTKNPSERVLVAAQDNLTVDYLFDIVTARLPLIGPMRYRVPLIAARIRQGMMTEAVEDLSGFGNPTNENLEAFQRGKAQVLFAPEAGQVGFNLQCARILVLYSVPWKPEEVEQWIGRLDRIGNAAAFAPDAEARTIEIYTIAQKGLVDEKVVAVLQRFRAFERTVNLDGEHLREVARLIESSALRPHLANWCGLEKRTEAMAAEDEVKELESELRAYLPWTVDWASSVRRQLDALPPAPLQIGSAEHAKSGPRSWDRAVEGMLKLLRLADEYFIRWNKDPDGGKFQSLWYRFDDIGQDGRKSVSSRVIFTIGANPSVDRNPRHAHAFITRRGDIAAPPRRFVTLTLNDGDLAKRPLHFVSFGNALHDEIVNGWLPRREEFSINLHLPEHHPIIESSGSSVFLIRLAVLNPASWLEEESVIEDALHAVAAAATRTPKEQIVDLMSPFCKVIRCAIEADSRWIRAHITAQLLVHGLKAQKGNWAVLGLNEIRDILDPVAHNGNDIPPAAEWKRPEKLSRSIEYALNWMRSKDKGLASTFWSPRFPGFERALQLRIFVIQEEMRDACDLAISELRKAQSALVFARNRGNPGQVTRARNVRNVAADKVDMTHVLWQKRENWLSETSLNLKNVLPEERLTAVVQVRRMP